MVKGTRRIARTFHGRDYAKCHRITDSAAAHDMIPEDATKKCLGVDTVSNRMMLATVVGASRLGLSKRAGRQPRFGHRDERNRGRAVGGSASKRLVRATGPRPIVAEVATRIAAKTALGKLPEYRSGARQTRTRSCRALVLVGQTAKPVTPAHIDR
jgi:hypothetical protein